MLDGLSLRVMGWALPNQLKAALVLEVLDMAIAARKPTPENFIHHSHRGIQCACADCAARLVEHTITASMSQDGNSQDYA